jgi:hypothetical protein
VRKLVTPAGGEGAAVEGVDDGEVAHGGDGEEEVEMHKEGEDEGMSV